MIAASRASGLPKWTSSPLKHSAADRGAVGSGPLQSGVHHPFSLVLPLTTGCRSLHQRRALSFGWVELSEPDPDDAMLSRATENVRLMWNS